MKENYIIDILGKQFYNDESDEITVTTVGKYYERTGKKFIVYKEYDEEDPEDKRISIVKIENDNKVTIIRTGKYSSRLTLEKDKRHQCHYNTVAGELMIGVSTNKMKIDVNEDGGVMEVGYTIDFNLDLVSNNEFRISFKKNTTNN